MSFAANYLLTVQIFFLCVSTDILQNLNPAILTEVCGSAHDAETVRRIPSDLIPTIQEIYGY